nr:uncharacterized protein LOC119716112 [Anas platyrhynchos]XP_038031440.1 uncharacterized protein LOC119716112 [Anas platyrhynchos]XP_038031443.1 uncharacterized protein LOC119716112 [Anas platyrhynchos]
MRCWSSAPWCSGHPARSQRAALLLLQEPCGANLTSALKLGLDLHIITEYPRLEGCQGDLVTEHLAQSKMPARAGCPGPRPGAFWSSPRRRPHSLSGQPVPGLCHLPSTAVLPGAHRVIYVIYEKVLIKSDHQPKTTLTSCPVTGHQQEGSCSVVFLPSHLGLYVLMGFLSALSRPSSPSSLDLLPQPADSFLMQHTMLLLPFAVAQHIAGSFSSPRALSAELLFILLASSLSWCLGWFLPRGRSCLFPLITPQNPVSPFLQPVTVPLDGSTAPSHAPSSPASLAHVLLGAFCPSIQVINEGFGNDWPQC